MRCSGVGGAAAAATGVDGLLRHWAAVWCILPQFSHLAPACLEGFRVAAMVLEVVEVGGVVVVQALSVAAARIPLFLLLLLLLRSLL